MRYQFPRTLKAADAEQRSQWHLADALLAEVEPRLKGPRGLDAAARELEANGTPLGTSYLRSLRNTAEIFPPNRRHALPWKVHEAAGNPDTLDVIVRVAKKADAKVTIWYVAAALKQHRAEIRANREKAKADANTKKTKAEVAERQAREEERTAKSAEAKAKAKRKREEATERRRQAAKEAKAARTAPKSQDRPPPADDEVDAVAFRTQLMTLSSDSAANGVRFEKMLGKGLDELSPKMVAGLMEAALSVANIWTRAAARLRQASASKRNHLQVVNE